ncbi:hypothetical protein GCM10022243_62510 [Saccharothrix violaceirubra]|uniref:Uncharacterized protein n=1 Tax=Saccharothrix violaceirubra TaxID=413306 RepID=A0A7W7T7Y1_9PSEU|nr:hypothetical protein [Saccharothrix violaceirubra]MBB4968229.1 hypothetical protein [Saccharothrix violaceirubra]
MPHSHRRKRHAGPKIALAAAGVLVLLAVVQGVVSGVVGIGAFSLDLRPTTSPPVAPIADSASDVTTTPPPRVTEEAAEEARVAIGSWKRSRGLLTVEVTRVDYQDGRLSVHAVAVNASAARMELPVATVSAVDDAGGTYGASVSTSQWPASIPKSGTITGRFDFEGRPSAAAKTLDITFAGILGQLAPTGGSLTVDDVVIPR